MDWPWKRFNKFYEAMVKRELVDELQNRKLIIIGSLWTREFEKAEGLSNAVKEIEDSYDQVIDNILGSGEQEEEKDEDKIDYENDPFFAAAKRSMDRQNIPLEADEDPSTKEMLELQKDLDQF